MEIIFYTGTVYDIIISVLIPALSSSRCELPQPQCVPAKTVELYVTDFGVSPGHPGGGMPLYTTLCTRAQIKVFSSCVLTLSLPCLPRRHSENDQ